MSLAKKIEMYLKKLLEKANSIEVQRNELAEYFQCVPSQINYVLSTRFTLPQGYIVESRRGGGGYVRIIKLSWKNPSGTQVKDIYHNLGIEIDQREAEGVLERLAEERLITRREYFMLRHIISREVLQIGLPQRDYIRARIIQAALEALSRNDI